jgi:hypothetical protein
MLEFKVCEVDHFSRKTHSRAIKRVFACGIGDIGRVWWISGFSADSGLLDVAAWLIDSVDRLSTHQAISASLDCENCRLVEAPLPRFGC